MTKVDFISLELGVCGWYSEREARVTSQYCPPFRSRDRLEPDESEGYEIEDVEMKVNGAWVSVAFLLTEDQYTVIEESLGEECD